MKENNMRKAIFPGSFDPLTNGHVETVNIATTIFDKVFFVIMTNTNKNIYLLKRNVWK